MRSAGGGRLPSRIAPRMLAASDAACGTGAGFADAAVSAGADAVGAGVDTAAGFGATAGSVGGAFVAGAQADSGKAASNSMGSIRGMRVFLRVAGFGDNSASHRRPPDCPCRPPISR
jgi:hypothetical protein